MESDTKEHCIQVITGAPCITDLKIRFRTRMRRNPSRKAVIVRELRGAEDFAGRIEDTALAVSSCGRGRLAIENLAHHALLSPGFDCICESCDIHDRRERESGATVEMSN